MAVSIGHSAATVAQARAGYGAGASTTTHLFNAMSGIDHRAPGVAVAALLDDEVFTELIADGVHVDRTLWPLITRLKRADRLLAVSDAISLAGTGDGRGRVGTLEVEVRGDRVTLAGTSTLAGSVLSLDVAVRNLVESGVPLPDAVAAASRNPIALLGVTDRGRIAPGLRADLVELAARPERHARNACRRVAHCSPQAVGQSLPESLRVVPPLPSDAPCLGRLTPPARTASSSHRGVLEDS